MRILFTIPHYFSSEGNIRYTSLSSEPRPRIEALTRCICALHELYGKAQKMLDFTHRTAVTANETTAHEIAVIVCTTQGRHLLEELPVKPKDYMHCPTDAKPMMLGFECHAVLRNHIGSYDYYCYLEDDAILHDPWLFVKLAWFNTQFGDASLLQPNRYELSQKGNIELSAHGVFRKTYGDGLLPPLATASFQNVSDRSQLLSDVLGISVCFVRATNPHSGCFFLNAKQMAHWAEQPFFLDRDTSFASPLDSAATLGIMRTFRVYKPAPECASFLEIEHFDDTSHRWRWAGVLH